MGSGKKSARGLAVSALVKMREPGAYSSSLLDRMLDESDLNLRDKQLATALFYGVLERRMTLEHIIKNYAPGKKQDPEIKEILCISLYSIIYSDKIPDSAAVSEGVNLARAFGKTSASGFVNGVLRSFLRDGKTIPSTEHLPKHERLAAEHSAHPELVRELLNEYPGTAEEILSGFNLRPGVFLRVNTLKTTAAELTELLAAEKITALPDPDLPDCLQVVSGGDLRQTDICYKGLFHIQDKRSQMCAHALEPGAGDRIYDCCAAPGGKTALLAQLAHDRADITAGELHESRVLKMRALWSRLGIKNITAICKDASVPDSELGLFDKIFCDLPCSGVGTAGRKPEIKYKHPDEFAELPGIQTAILSAVAERLKPGGTLVYTTCTLRKAENEAVVERFLSEHPDFEPVALPEMFGKNVCMTTLLPHAGADGFFAAKLTRKTGCI